MSRCGFGFGGRRLMLGSGRGSRLMMRGLGLRARLKELERENRELRRANEILKSASIFFATELDGRTRK